MVHLVVLLVVLAAVAAAGVPVHVRGGERVVLEPAQDRGLPEGWHVDRRAAAPPLTLHIALKQQHAEDLEALLLRVSSPDSPSYGQYLTGEEMAAMVRPGEATLARVVRWLADAGVEEEHDCRRVLHGDWLVCDVRPEAAEVLLDVRMVAMRHAASGMLVTRADPARAYSVPRSVADHVDFVGGVHRLPKVAREAPVARRAPAIHVGVSPRILRDAYNISKDVRGAADSNSISVAQFLNQFYHQSDLELFWKEFNNGLPLPDVTVVGKDTGLAGTEASLDIEYASSMSLGVPMTFWSTTAQHEGQEAFLDWVTALLNSTAPPLVNSISYGDQENSLDAAYTDRLNNEFKKAGIQGLTLLFATGDSGATFNSSSNTFSPTYPPSSPYITSVGGTEFTSATTYEQTGDYISSGGFSNRYATPEWQRAAVQQYLATSSDLPNSAYYNASGRAFPDVSGLSEGYTVVANLITMPLVGGTSCSTPVFSGIVAMLNDKRLAAGKAPLGFLAPLLYASGSSTPSLASALTDITTGCNAGAPSSTGFCAATGWDAVTGFGTPNYGKMLDVAMQLP